VPTGGTFWIILKHAPPAEKRSAWAFLRFMHQPENAIAWATQTGYLPVTRGAIARLEEQGYYRAHPNDRVALDQLSVALPWPWSESLFQVQREIVQPRLERAVLSADQSARRALDDARRLAAENLK
jgi:sn-glycerol 3-phosphate transport system substrate-binding protein